MKIMHVGQLIGGLDVYIRNSVYNCKDDSMEFVLVCGRKDSHSQILRNGKKVLEHHVNLFRDLNPFYDMVGFFQVLYWVIRERPDIIHCHSAKGGMFGRLAGWMTGTRTVYTPHAFSYLSARTGLRRSVFLWLERLTRMGAYLLACSESERKKGVEEVGYRGSRALVWRNSVPDASRLAVVPHGLGHVPYACYIGRPCYQKNTLFLADVVAKVRSRGCPLKFLLLGVGYFSSDLEKLESRIRSEGLEDMISLKPWISHEECLGYLRSSMFYITTSLYEGLPLSVIEAMSLGKAIVASDVVGNRDCVHNGVNGFLVKLDADAFADRIVTLWHDSDMRTMFGKNSRDLFVSDFMIDNQIDKLYGIYMELGAGKQA